MHGAICSCGRRRPWREQPLQNNHSAAHCLPSDRALFALSGLSCRLRGLTSNLCVLCIDARAGLKRRRPMDSVASVRAGDDSRNKTRMMTDEHNSPAPRCGRLISRNTKRVALVGCLIVSLILTTTSASAHVKWFVVCNVSDTPLPIGAVFTTTFFLCAALFLILFY